MWLLSQSCSALRRLPRQSASFLPVPGGSFPLLQPIDIYVRTTIRPRSSAIKEGKPLTEVEANMSHVVLGVSQDHMRDGICMVDALQAKARPHRRQPHARPLARRYPAACSSPASLLHVHGCLLHGGPQTKSQTAPRDPTTHYALRATFYVSRTIYASCISRTHRPQTKSQTAPRTTARRKRRLVPERGTPHRPPDSSHD